MLYRITLIGLVLIALFTLALPAPAPRYCTVLADGPIAPPPVDGGNICDCDCCRDSACYPCPPSAPPPPSCVPGWCPDPTQ